MKCLFIPFICIVVSLGALSGTFAACTQEECSEINDPGCTARAIRAYDDCRRREKIEKEARDAARREQAGKEAAQGAEEGQKASQSKYPFMDDIREINKPKTKW